MMQRMSRVQRLLVISILLALEERYKVIRKTIRQGGTLPVHNHTESQITDLHSAYTDAEAIAAVEGEATLDLTGVIPDSAYPNALLLDGSRKMTDDFDLDTHNIWGVGNPTILGFKDDSKRFCYGGYDGLSLYGAYMQMFGGGYMGAGESKRGSAEFVIFDDGFYSWDKPFFNVWCFDGSWHKLLEVVYSYYNKKITSHLNFALAAGKAVLNADHVELDEITTPTAVANHGKVYTKTDNKLYFQDGAGTEHEIAFV